MRAVQLSLVRVACAVVSGLLLVLWVLSINSRSVSSVLHLAGCIPPLDHPAPRREGYAQVYEKELQKEAVQADNGKVGYDAPQQILTTINLN